MSIFRQAALDRLASPEQLDKLIKITSPQSWLILLFCGIIIFSSIIWGVFGTIPVKIQAQGILIGGQGTKYIMSNQGGIISDVSISKDSYVHRGDVIARINQDDIVKKIDQLKKELNMIQTYVLDEEFDEEQISENVYPLYEIKKSLADINQQIENLTDVSPYYEKNADYSKIEIQKQQMEIQNYELAFENAEKDLKDAQDELKKAEALYNAGFISKDDYDFSAKQVEDAEMNIKNTELMIKQQKQILTQLNIQYDQALKDVEKARTEYENNKENLENKKEALQDNFKSLKNSKIMALNEQISQLEDILKNSEIISDVDGKVLSVTVKKGDVIQAGSSVANILLKEDETDNLGVVLYVPIQEGKKLMPGMGINVYPTTVNRQEYGHMEAVVTEVSDYAVTQEEMLGVIGNDELVGMFSQMGVLIQVKALLQKDESSVSGYYWSSTKGKDVVVDEGTLCSASITIEQKKPITMIIPILKEKVLPSE